MKVLVVGKGGREHALAKAASKSKLVDTVYVAPGSEGMKDVATPIAIAADDFNGLVQFAKDEHIDVTIVGPEDILALGIVDYFTKAGLVIFGPSQAASQIEASKDFAKALMKKYQIPTAAYETFKDKEAALTYIKKQGVPIVIKEDGLKAGKGVTVAFTLAEAIEAIEIAFSLANNKVVIEEYLAGFEFSLMCFVYHDLVIPMEIAQDHKCVYDGDKGANTGGMGAYSPVKKITQAIVDEALTKVMRPAAKAMVAEGTPFVGFLYGGMILTNQGVKTIEFNARFGDPEAEVILPRLESDFIDVILQVLQGKEVVLQWSKQVSIGVVLASSGYPQTATNGAKITGLETVDANIYHMGTSFENGVYYTNGGRVLLIQYCGDTLQAAYEHVYKEIPKIKCNALFNRSDIGKKDMEE